MHFCTPPSFRKCVGHGCHFVNRVVPLEVSCSPALIRIGKQVANHTKQGEERCKDMEGELERLKKEGSLLVSALTYALISLAAAEHPSLYAPALFTHLLHPPFADTPIGTAAGHMTI